MKTQRYKEQGRGGGRKEGVRRGGVKISKDRKAREIIWSEVAKQGRTELWKQPTSIREENRNDDDDYDDDYDDYDKATI